MTATVTGAVAETATARTLRLDVPPRTAGPTWSTGPRCCSEADPGSCRCGRCCASTTGAAPPRRSDWSTPSGRRTRCSTRGKWPAARPAGTVELVYTRCAPAGMPTGRLDAAAVRAAAPSPAAEPALYVCGPTGFVELVADALVEAGHDVNAIRTERFGPSGGA